jgi:hypothetical protein
VTFRYVLSIAAAVLVGLLLVENTMKYCDIHLPQTYHPVPGVSCPVWEHMSRSEMAKIAVKGASIERSAPDRLLAVRDELAAEHPPGAAYVSIHWEGGLGGAHSSLTATRDTAGRWHLVLRRHSVMDQRNADLVLTEVQAVQLEKRLRSPCLNSEPAVVLARGFHCLDGPMTITDFAFEGRHRTIAQDCISVGSPHELARFLYGLLPPEPTSKNAGLTVHEKRTGLCPSLHRWFGGVM